MPRVNYPTIAHIFKNNPPTKRANVDKFNKGDGSSEISQLATPPDKNDKNMPLSAGDKTLKFVIQ